MDKIGEDEIWISYKFYTTVAVGEAFNKKGKLRTQFEDKYGYCKFNKITEEFELILDKTDPYYLIKKRREVLLVYARLVRQQRDYLVFPETLDIATG